MLYNPERHQPCEAVAWDESRPGDERRMSLRISEDACHGTGLARDLD